VTIAFADGARESIEIDLANPNSGTSWRLVIGTQPARRNHRLPAHNRDHRIRPRAGVIRSTIHGPAGARRAVQGGEDAAAGGGDGVRLPMKSDFDQANAQLQRLQAL
jgi:hypothetical protein